MTQEEFTRAYANGTLEELFFSKADYERKKSDEVEDYCSVAANDKEHSLNDIARAFLAGAKFCEDYTKHMGGEIIKAAQEAQSHSRKLNDNEVSEVANMQKKIDHYEQYLECLQVSLWREQTQIISLHDEIKDHAYDVLWLFLDYVLKYAPDVVRDFNNERNAKRKNKPTKQMNNDGTNDIK